LGGQISERGDKDYDLYFGITGSATCAPGWCAGTT
jgi:hypothetical protein